MPSERRRTASEEFRALTRLSRIEKVLRRCAQGGRVTKREARAALKDLFDVRECRNTPPPPRTIPTLRAWMVMEEETLRKGRGPTLPEMVEASPYAERTIPRHRDTLAAHGCLTRLSANELAGGNWVSSKYARENIDEWESLYAEAIEDALRLCEQGRKNRAKRG